jgi:hypothetical protein
MLLARGGIARRKQRLESTIGKIDQTHSMLKLVRKEKEKYEHLRI